MTNPPLRPPTRPLRLWLAWVGSNAVGELVGLGSVFAIGAWIATRYGEPEGLLGGLLAAGSVVGLAAVEGAVVGHAQWWVLRSRLPRVTRREWVVATVIGAVVAWMLGMIPAGIGSFSDSSTQPVPMAEPSEVVVMAAATALGLVLGTVLAGAQWRVLRRAARPALTWLPANAIAWAAGMPLTFWLVGQTLAEGVTLTRLVQLVAGLGVVGAVVGAIHGLWLVFVLHPVPPSEGCSS